MSETSPRLSVSRPCMTGYLHRVETRAIGLISRRRYWFALTDVSPYLYWFKERDDVTAVGRLCLTGSAFTYNPQEKGRFEIHAGNTIHVLEASSDKLRDEWIRALQDSRKRSRKHSTVAEEKIEISSLSSPSSAIDINPVNSPLTSRSADFLINNFLGPYQSTSFESSSESAPLDIDNFQQADATSSPSGSYSTFYLSPDGQLNENSMEMPKTITSPETVLQRIADRTNESLAEVPKRAIDIARKSFKMRKSCDECKSRSDSVNESEERCRELEDHVVLLEDIIKALKSGLVTAQKQVETLRQLDEMPGDNDVKDFLLQKEKIMTDLQMENNSLHRQVQFLETENRDLESKVAYLTTSVEAFRDSVRTKEELIMRLCEEKSDSVGGEAAVIGDVEVPEGILIDVNSAMCDEAAQKVFDDAGVHDINELKDLVEGYKSQNCFLNQEIIELHAIIQSLESRERTLIRKNFDIEACYYQLKSRYLMVLNHFKSPEKPGKIMEPGVLRELLDEANRTPKDTLNSETDTLGFYLNGKEISSPQTKGNTSSDLLDIAAKYMEKSNSIVEATSLEQSESYMAWLQSWDSLLVNWVGRSLSASPELKSLVRSGVPAAYRGRVWKSLVFFSVKDKIAELGNGYFQCMLRKAKAKKEEGVFDSAIKQIDLDLARTLPNNKHFDDSDSSKIEMLRRVLYAFRYHNKEVGYCQGLNRLAAIALLYLDEEDAFWFMVSCVEHLQPEGYYTSTLIGAVADQKVLRDLVAEKLPKLAVHLKNLEVDLSLFTLSWFLTCFVDVLPHSIYLSIFDIFLYEGNKVLFRFALAVLKQCEVAVLNCKTIGTVHACLSRASEHISDFKSLSQIAFNDLNPFPQKMIETKRNVYLTHLKGQGYS